MVSLEIDNASFSLGDGTNPLVSVVITTGTLDGEGPGRDGRSSRGVRHGQRAGVHFTGGFHVQVDTTVASARYVRIASQAV